MMQSRMESLEISCRQENSWSRISVFCRDSFQCSCMRTVARLFLRVSSTRRIIWNLRLKNIPSWHGLFVLHGHRLCRDIVFVLIASVAIWKIPDIYREIIRHWTHRFTLQHPKVGPDDNIRGILLAEILA